MILYKMNVMMLVQLQRKRKAKKQDLMKTTVVAKIPLY